MVASVESMNDEETMVLDSVDRFLERDVKPYARELDHADEWPAEIVEKMKELGLFGATIGQEYGGLGLNATTYTKIVERVARVWMSVSGIFNSHLIMAAAVEKYGTEEQKQHWLPRFATGELRGGIALTEPDCGTDLQAIRTHAERQDDHYVVNGAKTWISNSVRGNILAVLTKTDPKAEPRHKGTKASTQASSRSKTARCLTIILLAVLKDRACSRFLADSHWVALTLRPAA